MDLHAQQIAGFTNLPIDCLQFRPTLVDTLKDKNIQVVVAPDIGSVKRANSFAEKIKSDFAFVTKKRKGDTDVEATQFVGDVNGKNVLIIDDLTESAGTLIMAANECKKNGATNVYCAVTHSALTDIGVDRMMKALAEGVIKKFFMSNTTDTKYVENQFETRSIPSITNYETDRTYATYIITSNRLTAGSYQVVDVAPVFGEAIMSIHNDESVSSLFV
jgi:ribose-phosphate pyrophosphokinase